MRVNFTFRHMDSTEALKGHTENKLERLKRFEETELDVHVIFEVEKFHKTVEFTVAAKGHTFVVSETRDDMYEAIDIGVDKLNRQLSRDKSRRKHHKGHQGAVSEYIG